ncbi:unnamed protein product [Cyprideis torosa]|uniref:Uncharacterized protein n=1 Tax=Cyprideis torosa TaxID=163714 RepID=A0A7R8ZVE2_9CRUS|nr:unnamed protein product [Cyprideis torosa]CAG0903021.1 unnamed protein product [Cyprideis torosa]
MKVLVVDNYDSFVYNIVHILRELGAEITIKKNDQLTIEEVDAFDKIVLSPGPGIPQEAGVMPEILQTYAASKSILGVCLGHQAIAENFGVGLINLKEPKHGVHSLLKRTVEDYIFEGIPLDTTIGHYHSWVVDPTLQDNLEALAYDEEGNLMALRHSVYDHQHLTVEEAKELIIGFTQNRYSSVEMAAILSAIRMRPLAIQELMGFKEGILSQCKRLDFSSIQPMDICGTGGDGKNTFNISTLSAFVIAAAGIPVAKHGNYASSSIAGSSNVLEFLGIPFFSDEGILQTQLENEGLCFIHAPLFHTGMKHVAPVRKELQIKTFFNLLGPLVNPCSPTIQLAGVYDLEVARLYAEIFEYESKNSIALFDVNGYDEISLTNQVRVLGANIDRVIDPIDFGFDALKPNDIFGGNSIQQAAEICMNVLERKATQSQHQVVVANAAFAIQTFHPQKTLQECVSMAEQALNKFKRKSPSKNWIFQEANIKDIVPAYAKYGASAISVLTDTHFFGGSTNDLVEARSLVHIPLLRKDFIIDEIQVYETKALGADILLLIAEMLTKEEIEHLTICAKRIGLEVLLEMHSAKELPKIHPMIDILGVNNRDLHTFQVDLDASIALLDLLPKNKLCISESGIHHESDAIKLKNAGFHGKDGYPNILTLPQTVKRVGVFVNASVAEIVEKVEMYQLDVVQLHGDESAEFCKKIQEKAHTVWKAFGIDDTFDFDSLTSYVGRIDAFLFDAKTPQYGGSGNTFSWSVLDQYTLNIPFLLSGGLGVENSNDFLSFQHSMLVGYDLNSALETSPGVKDAHKVQQVIERIRKGDR